MNVGLLLLRALLCLGLLLGGAAQATALTHVAHASQPARMAAPPCHEADEAHALTDTGRHLVANQVGPVKNRSGCCKSDACGCACNHGAAAMMPSLQVQVREVRHSTLVGLPATRYASPALPRLNRPPIA